MKFATQKKSYFFNFIAFLAIVSFVHPVFSFDVNDYESSESQQAHYKQFELQKFYYFKGAVNENEEKTQEERDIEAQHKAFAPYAHPTLFIARYAFLFEQVGTQSTCRCGVRLSGFSLHIYTHSLCI